MYYSIKTLLPMQPTTPVKKVMLVPLVALLFVVGGTLLGYSSLVRAQTNDTTNSVTEGSSTDLGRDHRADKKDEFAKGGHRGKNGKTEEILTGDTLEKVTTAATAALPGATIDRAETDAEGAMYEAHMTKADGSHVTLKFDQNFTVTDTEEGMMKR
jgi:hypothetical protein